MLGAGMPTYLGWWWHRSRPRTAASRFTHSTTDTRGARANNGTLRANTKSKMDIPEGGGWYGARSLLEWATRAKRRAQGARPARVAPVRNPRTPRRLHRSAEPWLAPGRAIQLRVVRCIADVGLVARARCAMPPLSASSLKHLYYCYSYWPPDWTSLLANSYGSKF